jgi:hypothetical protein
MKICFECDADLTALYPLSPFVNVLNACPLCGGPVEDLGMSDIERLEKRVGGVQEAIRLLGVSQSRWYDYRAGAVPLPPYVQASIRAHLAASDRQLKKWAGEA